MQLVAYGAQDIYLTGNPQITFFKVVYRRHTNFSMESIQQTINGTAGFGKNVSATISRNGDLVYRIYLEHDATFNNGILNCGLVEHYGHSLIKECEIEIGGQNIDKHTSLWNRVYSDLNEFNPNGHFGGVGLSNTGEDTWTDNSTGTLYQLMTGNGFGLNSDDPSANNEMGAGGKTINGFVYKNATAGNNITIPKIFLPLNFWFCRNPGLSLPLIALQYHEVKVKMIFEDIGKLARTGGTTNFGSAAEATESTVVGTPNFNLWCDYIYLDTDERRRFAQVSHEYLIEQLQYSDNTITAQSPSIDLNFNHPVKELIWVTRSTGTGGNGGRCAPGLLDISASPVSIDTMGDGTWILKLNGHDRFEKRNVKYFTRTQVWEHHKGYGSVPTQGYADNDLNLTTLVTQGADAIAVYSFSLRPEDHQPSGTCNFSRIDNAQLVGSSLTVNDETGVPASTATTNVSLTIFAVNYNVLRIMSGMGGLAYSN